MKLHLLLGASAILICGSCATQAAPADGQRPADSEFADLGRELRQLETAKPAAPELGLQDDEIRHRFRTHDPREAAFYAPALVAEFGWFGEDGTQHLMRRMVRTNEAMQIGGDSATEFFWLRRNPVDPSRMSGCLVRPADHLILEYSEADLHDEGYGSSWSALAQFGVYLDDLALLTATGEQETAFGLTFDRMIATHASPISGDHLVDIWWNDEHRLPLRVRRMVMGSATEQRLLSLELRVPADFVEPVQRWPEYESLDLVDYREGLHEHGGHSH